MGLFGKLLKTTFDIVTTPIDIVKDVATLGGSLTDEESAIVKKARRLKDDLEETRDEVDKL